MQCHGYVVMPDHLHAIIELRPGQTLAQVMHDLSSHTAHDLNRLEGRRGPVWQRGFYDHQLRDEHGYDRHIRYIAHNPVRKGFVDRWDAWPWVAIHPKW